MTTKWASLGVILTQGQNLPDLQTTPPPIIIRDEFNGDGSLAGRIAPNGNAEATWSVLGASSPAWNTAGGIARVTSGVGNAYALLPVPTDEYSVESQLSAVHATSARRGAVVGGHTDTTHYVMLRVDPTTGHWAAFGGAGSPAVLTLSDVTAAVGQIARIERNGDEYKFLVDGVLFATHTVVGLGNSAGLMGSRYSSVGVTQDPTTAWARIEIRA